MRAEANPIRDQFHIEDYDPFADVPAGPKYDAIGQSGSSTDSYIVPHGTYRKYDMRNDVHWGNLKSEDLGFAHQGVPEKKRVGKITNRMASMLRNTDVYEVHLAVYGGLRDKEGRLVAVTEVVNRIASLRRSISRVSAQIAALNPSTGASYKFTSFVLTPDEYVVASSGGAEPLNVTLTNYTWFAYPPECLHVPTTFMNASQAILLVCNRLPSQIREDPLIVASAPRLPALCRNGSPLLGRGQRVQMMVGGVVNSFVIICDEVSTGMESPQYQTFRVVTIVSEKELVDPLLTGLVPAAVKVGAAGAAVAFAAIAVALAISVYIQRRSGQVDTDERDGNMDEEWPQRKRLVGHTL